MKLNEKVPALEPGLPLALPISFTRSSLPPGAVGREAFSHVSAYCLH